MKKLFVTLLILCACFLLIGKVYADCSCGGGDLYKLTAFFPDGKIVSWNNVCRMSDEGSKVYFCADGKWFYLHNIQFFAEQAQ